MFPQHAPERLVMLEMQFPEFGEQILSLLHDHNFEHIVNKARQCRSINKTMLTSTMRKLEGDNDALRTQISLIKEEASLRENTSMVEIQKLRGETVTLKYHQSNIQNPQHHTQQGETQEP